MNGLGQKISVFKNFSTHSFPRYFRIDSWIVNSSALGTVYCKSLKIKLSDNCFVLFRSINPIFRNFKARNTTVLAKLYKYYIFLHLLIASSYNLPSLPLNLFKVFKNRSSRVSVFQNHLIWATLTDFTIFFKKFGKKSWTWVDFELQAYEQV